MRRMRFTLAAAVIMVVASSGAVQAQAFGPPVAANAFITFGGLDWAWASPCALGGPGSCVNEYVLVDGFRFATADEWAARPTPDAFLDPNGNYQGMRCAAGWFNVNPQWQHCDYSDAQSGYLYSGPGNYGSQGYNGLSETWLVRGAAEVPEPATFALLAVGLLGLAPLARRRRRLL